MYRHVDLFFFNDTATTEIYTLSLHDALPISRRHRGAARGAPTNSPLVGVVLQAARSVRLLVRDHRPRRQALASARSEEHTSELQSRQYLVCRLLLEKKIHQLYVRHSSRNITH